MNVSVLCFFHDIERRPGWRVGLFGPIGHASALPARQCSDRARLRAERKLDQNQADTAIRTRTSGVTVREKALAAMQADLDFAKLELYRARVLMTSRVINERQLQTAQTAVTKLEIQILQLQAEHEQAESSPGEARGGQDRLGGISAPVPHLTHPAPNLAAQLPPPPAHVVHPPI